jgi:hypothetical protein
MAGTRSAAGVTNNSITALLARFDMGNREIEARLIPQIRKRRLTEQCTPLDWANYTLQSTVLLNEAYIRFVQKPWIPRYGRAPFFAVATRHKAGTRLERKLSGRP